MHPPILKYAALHALGTVAYVTLVASFFFYATPLLGPDTKETVFIPIAMLLFFLVSATVTGSLVLGRPILWYLDGKRKEAVHLLFATVGGLAVMMILAFCALVVAGR